MLFQVLSRLSPYVFVNSVALSHLWLPKCLRHFDIFLSLKQLHGEHMFLRYSIHLLHAVIFLSPAG